ncbi:MAG: CotH kinase family protein [Oscillospiraceae bacterium]|nr:CotH kinase family protein [Oscillospiraceae bacterium]
MSLKKTLTAAALLASLLLSACVQTAPPAPPAEETPAPAPVESAEPAVDLEAEAAALCLSEIMPKNRASLLDADGSPSDWVELYNRSSGSVSLAGWQLSDKSGSGWTLPDGTLGAGERLVIFASGKDRRAGELHTDFSLGAGETLRLLSPHGLEADSLLIPETEVDCSLIRGGDGLFTATLWPTPGCENSAAGYELRQSALLPAGPLAISEVMVANFRGTYERAVGYGDWVELRNVSDQPVELSDYYLSDDEDDYFAFRLPAGTLGPGELCVLRCRDDGEGDLLLTLDDGREQLYLCSADRVLDAVSLHDIPLDGSYGRLDGAGGFFYFAAATPGKPNTGGARRVSERPVVLTAGGCYEGVERVDVALQAAPGAVVRYTLDGSVPDERSALYEGPIPLTATTILRAVATEPGCLPSRALTESYFLNEGHELPVVSLVLDDFQQFRRIYNHQIKHYEMPGSVALYEDDGSFSIGCGVTLSGATSLSLPKKNLSVRFRGAYGDEWLDYDVFDGGVDRFRSLTLRSGQDYYFSVIRNELCQDLALEFSEHLLIQRSKFCALYINGEYYGLYALKEKVTRQFYASTFGVSRDSVIMEEASVKPRDAFYQEVYDFVTSHSMADEANYAHVCEILDVDSLIDWAVLEGYFANNDLLSGNVRFCKSSEGDGKWRLVFYDLDAALHRRELTFFNLYGTDRMGQQISQILVSMLKNPAFREKLLARTAEALHGPLASAHVLQKAEEMYALIETERLRDFEHWHTSEIRFQNETKHMLRLLENYDPYAVSALNSNLRLSAEEKQTWFSDWLS